MRKNEGGFPLSKPTYRDQFALEAAQLWVGEPAALHHIGDSENSVYCFLDSNQRRFLRLTSSHHRSLSQIEAELDFIRYLHQGGVSVSLPVSSRNGAAVETMQGETHDVFVCVFEGAEGKPFTLSSHEANSEHFRLRGQTLGRLHALSKKYAPSANSRRFSWDEEDCLLHAGRYLAPSENVVWDEYHHLRDWLRKLPKGEQAFGLIHGDFGATNFRCQENRLTVFDFDDCCYHWFAYDLAITLYPHGWRQEAGRLFAALWAGYCEENKRNAPPTSDLINFCRLRQLYLFLTYAKKWGFADLSEQQASWFARKRENIAAGYKISGL